MKCPLDYSDQSFGIARGCEVQSPGCAHCYAKEDVERFGGVGLWGPPETTARKTYSAAFWKTPHKWNKDYALWEPAKHEGKIRPIVFCSPLCDVFEVHPTIDAEREKLWPVIKATPNLTWHIVTKRADNIAQNLPWGKGVPWENVWISVSIENDHFAKKRLPALASLNVAVRGVHCEPLLGPVPHLADYISEMDWILVGGESRDSDPRLARKMEPAWVTEIQKICVGAKIPFFLKQWGCQKPVEKMPDGSIRFESMQRWKAGNLFKGKVHHPWPIPKLGPR